jgi:hypothetical protein
MDQQTQQAGADPHRLRPGPSLVVRTWRSFQAAQLGSPRFGHGGRSRPGARLESDHLGRHLGVAGTKPFGGRPSNIGWLPTTLPRRPQRRDQRAGHGHTGQLPDLAQSPQHSIKTLDLAMFSCLRGIEHQHLGDVSCPKEASLLIPPRRLPLRSMTAFLRPALPVVLTHPRIIASPALRHANSSPQSAHRPRWG